MYTTSMMQSQDGPTSAVIDEPPAPNIPAPDTKKAGGDQGTVGENAQSQPRRKSIAFYLAFISLLIVVLIVSLDATILAVAIPAS